MQLNTFSNQTRSIFRDTQCDQKSNENATNETSFNAILLMRSGLETIKNYNWAKRYQHA